MTRSGIIGSAIAALMVLLVALWPLSRGLAQTGVTSSACKAGDKTYVVKKGDWLSKVFPGNWRQVADYNGVKAPYVIKAGNTLCVPKGNAKPKAAPKKSEARFIDLGRAPANASLDPDKRDKLIDLNPQLTLEEKQEAKRLFREKKCEKRVIGPDWVWHAMPFSSRDGTVKFRTDVRVRSLEQGGRVEVACVATLSTGKTVADPLSCGNISPVTIPEPEPDSKPGPEPQPDRDPEPKPGPEPEPKPEPESKPGKGAGRCSNIDPKAVVGAEHERAMNSGFATAALFCLFKGEDGQHGVGAGGNVSVASGSAGGGRFKSMLAVFGPAYEFISDHGWDAAARMNLGRLSEQFVAPGFEKEDRYTLAGPSAEWNLYQRRERGEKWFAKTQVFAASYFPISGDGPLSSYVNAGLRQFVYDGDAAHLYGQLGFLAETPSLVRGGNARIGIADPKNIVGVHAGLDFDLLNGGREPAVGWWVDLVAAGRHFRDVARQAQFRSAAEAAGVKFDALE